MRNKKIIRVDLTHGVYWIEIPEANLYLLCGSPPDSVKHLMKKGLIHEITTEEGVRYESGPNAILLSDIMLQKGSFSNMAEFPIMQMLYKQGLIIPGHPGNTGKKPLIIGSKEQVANQMQYIYRGNYGLINKEEIMSAGVSEKEAESLMRLKLKFSFGQISHPNKLIDTCVIDDKKETLAKGVTIERKEANVFVIKYKNESTTVDLNLKSDEKYAVPYALNYHNIRREYFSIIHSGEGDGWDTARPSMSSIIIFQGKTFLIDAGPNIDYTLNYLGIGLNEVHGLFHTHSHDDHFAGLTILMRTDHRIKYYATPLVRKCVTAKLSALLSLDDDDFDHYFDAIDLKPDEWNDVDGLEVSPVFSPHPVETTFFRFRSLWHDGYKTYSHMADIISFDVLKSMITKNKKEPGITKALYDSVKESYLEPHDIKKLDIGGGLIHGNSVDFKDDKSGKIILAHTSLDLLVNQKEIGSGSPFGTIDHLIRSSHDYLFEYAKDFLESYFPHVPKSELLKLLNCNIVRFNPESILLKGEQVNPYVYLILTGNVDVLQSEEDTHYRLSSGAILGELSGMTDIEISETYRATSFVNVLEIPSSFYYSFVKKNQLYHSLEELEDKRDFLRKTWLFGESISNPILNSIAQEMSLVSIPAGGIREDAFLGKILLLAKGTILMSLAKKKIRVLKTGDFFGEEISIFNFPQCYDLKATENCKLYEIPASLLNSIPIVRFKLHETYEIKISSLLNSETSSDLFKWASEYSINVHQLDQQHRKIFIICQLLLKARSKRSNKKVTQLYLKMLYTYATKHFSTEETMMQMYHYPHAKGHIAEHDRLLLSIEQLIKSKDEKEFTENEKTFVQDWIVVHATNHDEAYSDFLNSKGVF